MIHPSTIEEIKNRVDIVEVVGDFVTLKRSGSSFKALSPFTNEKTPSFYVVPSKGIFKDFSSGKGGDAITFVMEVDGLSYVEALKYLASKYGIEVKEEEQSDEALEAQNKRESLYIVLNYANEYFQRVLHDSDEGKAIGGSYFKERGFTEETIKKFQLGYSKDLWDGLMNEAIQKGYQKELLAEAGLIIDKEGKSYDRFRSRVMFPIHNVSGKAIAFGGRKLSSTDKSAKYINSPETELYNKSKVLYGLFFSKNSIRKEDNCFLVEGYTDVISMHQAGIENVVASSGTALTEEQVKLIKRYSQNVTVIFDGDAAGIKASMRGIDLLLEGDLNVKAVALPEGEDPDSYARNLGANGFKDFVEEEALNIIEFISNILMKEDKNDPIRRAESIASIIKIVKKVKDEVKRDQYIKKASSLFNVDEQKMISTMNSLIISDRNKSRIREHFPDAALDEDDDELSEVVRTKMVEDIALFLQEREAIRILLNHGNTTILDAESQDIKIANFYFQELEEIEFSHPFYSKILKTFKKHLENGRVIDAHYYLENEPDDIKDVVISVLVDEEKYSTSNGWFEKHKIVVPTEESYLRRSALTNIYRIKFRVVKKLIAEEMNEFGNREEDDSKVTDNEFLDRIMDLKSIEVEIAGLLGTVITD